MSDNALPDNVVTPETLEEDEVAADGDVLPSPVEKKKQVLPEKLHRDYTVADDDHPLAITAGSAEALKSNTPVQVQEILSSDLYQDEEVFFREQIQNHIAAVVREAKRRVKNEYGKRHLYDIVEHEHPELDTPSMVAIPKPAEDILEAAQELGYVPNIEVVLNHDENKIITRDNGIGMTTSEVLELWNEPAASGSGVDMSSAGKIGIGSLTWVTVAGTEGALIAKTRTRREETMSGKTVPPRDQQGFQFLAYFGGVLPLTGEVEDGFYGTTFEIPIRDDLDTEQFHSHMEQYSEILPVQVEWKEIGRSESAGELTDPEFEPDTFWSRFDDEPAIQIDRPGEFRVALDAPDVVKKGGSTNDTFIMDNPINRNESYNQSFDTLWNEHIQILNEQGLIIDGPNRGKTVDEVDELYGELADIGDEEKPMPDIPLPQPTASRDGLQRGEAHDRFLRYAEHLAIQRELERVSEYVNEYLDTDSVGDAFTFLRDRSTEFDLFYKLARNHVGATTPKNTSRLFDWFDSLDTVDFDADDADDRVDEDTGDVLGKQKRTHPKWDHLELLVQLRTKEISYAHSGTTGSPNNKENRKSAYLYEPLLMEEKGPIYVGATLNDHRVRVAMNTHPDAIVIKTRTYTTWQDEPYHADLIKEVPLHREDDGAAAYNIPHSIHQQHWPGADGNGATDGTAGYTPVPEDFEDRPVKIRCTENSAVDVRSTIGDLMTRLEETTFDQFIGDLPNGERVGRRWLVVFNTTEDEKVSDHWNLSKYVATVSCNNSEAEALLQYDSAFTYDEYLAMVSSVELETYNPLTHRTRMRTVEKIQSMDKKPIYSQRWTDKFEATLLGNEHDDLPETDSDLYERIREGILDKLDTRRGAISRDNWLLVKNPEDELKRVRLQHYLSIRLDEVGPKDFFAGYTTFGQRRYQYELPKTNHIKTSHSRYSKVYERAPYPAWDNDSDAWKRVNESYRGPNDREKAMYRALRDNLGIDPYNHSPERLEALLGHLMERCN